MREKPRVSVHLGNRGNRRFARFDHGSPALNEAAYGVRKGSPPPEYDLSRVTAPAILYSGEADRVADTEDARRLLEKLVRGRISKFSY